ncbi:MAG: hypothetical protein ACTS3T_05050, partial [Almyronema sp.]
MKTRLLSQLSLISLLFVGGLATRAIAQEAVQGNSTPSEIDTSDTLDSTDGLTNPPGTEPYSTNDSRNNPAGTEP